jgi:hypothetical protein
MLLTVGGVTNPVDLFSIDFRFNLYFAVRTTQAVNGGQDVFTQRALASWVFNGSGSVNSSGQWTNGGGNSGSSNFSIITSGSLVPMTVGTPINNLFAGETWATQ